MYGAPKHFQVALVAVKDAIATVKRFVVLWTVSDAKSVGRPWQDIESTVDVLIGAWKYSKVALVAVKDATAMANRFVVHGTLTNAKSMARLSRGSDIFRLAKRLCDEIRKERARLQMLTVVGATTSSPKLSSEKRYFHGIPLESVISRCSQPQGKPRGFPSHRIPFCQRHFFEKEKKRKEGQKIELKKNPG